MVLVALEFAKTFRSGADLGFPVGGGANLPGGANI